MKKRKIEIHENSDLIGAISNMRKKLGYTQEKLAMYSNIQRQSLSEIERNKVDPQLSNILKLAKLCGLKLYVELDQDDDARAAADIKNE